jgi:Rad52/22 family double-strand break repair protein
MSKATSAPTINGAGTASTVPAVSEESIFERLAAPFPPERVQWRIGATNQDKSRGVALAYIDARDVMERLDEVCTPAGWQRRYVPMGDISKCCEIGVRIETEWIWKADGAGATDYEAEKGAYSDSFKRAAVNWGVGRYLYDIASPWVALEARGRSLVIRKDESARLVQLLKGQQQQSAYAARLSGGYPRLEKLIRGAKTLQALEALWKREQATISRMPDSWVAALIQEKDTRKEQLAPGGTERMLEASLEKLNGHSDDFVPVRQRQPRVAPVRTMHWEEDGQ